MPVVSFSEGNELFDITPVENIFILEYMQNAAGDYVKVYLLGLTMCYHLRDDYSISRMASDLSLSEDEVKQAFTYWAQLGLIEILHRRPFEVRYFNIKRAMQKSNNSRVSLYTHQPLVLELQRIFGGRRLLGPSEVNYVMEWADEWKVAPEIITLVTAWCVDMKGSRVRFSYINKVLGDIYDQNLTTYAEVERYINDSDVKISGAGTVLRAWNISRLPTADEAALYRKWTIDYSVSKEAIREAQKHMTHINNPNFKYLDSLIEKLHSNNVKSVDEARKYFSVNSDIRSSAKEVYSRLGGLNVTEGRMELYRSWRDMGFSQHSILKAADALSREGYRSPDDLNATLERWHKIDMISDTSINDYMNAIAESSRQVSTLLSTWGENRAPKNHERRIYHTWIQKGYKKSLIDLACQKSEKAKDKIVYADKILTTWEEKGITTVDAANKEGFYVQKPAVSNKEQELPENDYFRLHNSWEEL
jgi:DnaD/phage-associated family protein